MRRYKLNEQNPIKTKRLLLTPMNDKELAQRIAEEPNELIRNAYTEMRRCVLAYPDQALWHTYWRMTLRETKQTVGYLGFLGEPKDQTAELGFDVPEEFHGEGYASEATKALCDWAFLRDIVYFVRVMTAQTSTVSNQMLKELEFYRIESPLEGHEYWELERPASAWIAVYLCFGLAIGLALGSSFFGNQALGMSIGMAAGVALGATLDSQDRAARKRVNEPKKLDDPEQKSKQKSKHKSK